MNNDLFTKEKEDFLIEITKSMSEQFLKEIPTHSGKDRFDFTVDYLEKLLNLTNQILAFNLE